MPINPKKTNPLRPLPMRITELQWERLNAARDYDDIAIQEHVRRALDKYLDMLDQKRSRPQPTPPDLPQIGEMPEFVRTSQAVAANAPTGGDIAGRRRVVYR